MGDPEYMMDKFLLLRFVSLPLIPICIYWWVESWLRKLVGLPSRDNCWTWAVRHYDYQGGDGICFHRSRSSWFPHVVIIKGMRQHNRMTIVILEYVPVRRVDGISSPPRKFDGYVRKTRLVEI